MFVAKICWGITKYLVLVALIWEWSITHLNARCYNVIGTNEVLVVPDSNRIGKNELFGFVAMKWRGIMKILMVTCTEIMGNICNFNYFCSDMVGNNDKFGCLLHWFVRSKIIFCLFLKIIWWGIITIRFFFALT